MRWDDAVLVPALGARTRRAEAEGPSHVVDVFTLHPVSPAGAIGAVPHTAFAQSPQHSCGRGAGHQLSCE